MAVFIKENSIVQIVSYTEQEDGRIISLKIQINDTKIQVVNVYVPNNPSERKHFINNLQHLIDTVSHFSSAPLIKC